MFKLRTTIFLVSIFCFVVVNNLKAASAVYWCENLTYGVSHKAGTEDDAKKAAEEDCKEKCKKIYKADISPNLVYSTKERGYCAIAYILNEDGRIEKIGCALGRDSKDTAHNEAMNNCTKDLQEKSKIQFEEWDDPPWYRRLF